MIYRCWLVGKIEEGREKVGNMEANAPNGRRLLAASAISKSPRMTEMGTGKARREYGWSKRLIKAGVSEQGPFPGSLGVTGQASLPYFVYPAPRV